MCCCQGEEDQLIHFCWKDRTNEAVEEDLILFPEEAEFKKIPIAKERVYMLQFKSSSRKLFYWMQEPKEDKDEEYCKRVNLIISGQNGQQLNVGLSEGSGSGDNGVGGGAWNRNALEILGGQLGLSELDLQSYWDQLRSQAGEDTSMENRRDENEPSGLSHEELGRIVTAENVHSLLELPEIQSRYFSFVNGTSKSRDEWQTLLQTSEFLEVRDMVLGICRGGVLSLSIDDNESLEFLLWI